MVNFLFNGTWGFFPKCVFWFMLGWVICSVREWGGNDGVELSSWLIGIAGTILAAFSLWLTLEAEK